MKDTIKELSPEEAAIGLSNYIEKALADQLKQVEEILTENFSHYASGEKFIFISDVKEQLKKL